MQGTSRLGFINIKTTYRRARKTRWPCYID